MNDKRYPKLVQCEITGVLAWVNSAEEESAFHRGPMWAVGISVVGAILGMGVFLLMLWFDVI